MLSEFKISRCSRRCFTLDRPLREGETYFSVVLESGDGYVRRDYAAESWQGPPEDAIGWWKNRMPAADEKKLVLAPPAVLIDLLRRMQGQPENAKSRYLLALTLLRRRIVRDAGTVPDGRESADANTLRVQVPADSSVIEVDVVSVSRGEVERLTDQLHALLYQEAAVEDGEE